VDAQQKALEHATKEEAKKSLTEAIALILEDRRADGLRAIPPDALRETVVVE